MLCIINVLLCFVQQSPIVDSSSNNAAKQDVSDEDEIKENKRVSHGMWYSMVFFFCLP